MAAHTTTQSPIKLTLSYKIVWGIASLGTATIAGTFGALQPIFYQDYLGLEARWIGIAAVLVVVLFLTEKLPVELTAFAGLATLALTGYVSPEEAFLGFSSPAVITMLSVFFVSSALLHTGVADGAAREGAYAGADQRMLAALYGIITRHQACGNAGRGADQEVAAATTVDRVSQLGTGDVVVPVAVNIPITASTICQ